jgi:hypothetical protein
VPKLAGWPDSFSIKVTGGEHDGDVFVLTYDAIQEQYRLDDDPGVVCYLDLDGTSGNLESRATSSVASFTIIDNGGGMFSLAQLQNPEDMFDEWAGASLALLEGETTMPILIPDRTKIKPTTTPARYPGIVKDGNVNPRPVRISATGSSGAGNPLIERADGANKNRGYYGYQITTDVDNGANAGENGGSVLRGCIVDGFTGVSPQLPIWADATALPNPEGTFSGLTHTDPADGTLPIGMGATATKIFFFP